MKTDLDETNLLAALGDVMRELRMEKDLSQEDFARAAGLHRTYISDVERGKRNMTVIVLRKLANALGKSASELLDLATK